MGNSKKTYTNSCLFLMSELLLYMDIPMDLHFFLQYVPHITAPTCYLHTLHQIVSQSSLWKEAQQVSKALLNHHSQLVHRQTTSLNHKGQSVVTPLNGRDKRWQHTNLIKGPNVNKVGKIQALNNLYCEMKEWENCMFGLFVKEKKWHYQWEKVWKKNAGCG